MASASAPSPLGGLEAVLETVPDAALVFDVAGDVVFASRSVEPIFGYLPSELLGRSIDTLVPVEQRAAHPEYRRGYLRDPVPRSMAGGRAVRMIRKDAGLVPATVSLAPLTTPGGTYVAAIVRTAAVGDDRLGVEHLVMSQRVARLGSWERDYVTGRVRWSPELYRILGVEPGTAEPSVDVLHQLLHPDDRRRLEAEYGRALREGGEVFVVARTLGPPRTLAVRGSLELDGDGRPVRSIGTVQDISAVTDLRPDPDSAVGRLQASFDQAPILTAPIGMAVVDVRPGRPIRRLMANQALADLMGLSPAELLEEALEERVHPADRPSYVRLLSEVASGTRDATPAVEVRIVRPDAAAERWVAVNGHLVRDGHGAPEYLVAHIQDISDRKRAEFESRDRAARDARIAAVLQDNLLPFVPHRVGPMSVASRHVPAGNGELVGGDWTDVFALPNGRIGIVVGDVAGHGIEAAATMSRLRAVVRMLAANGLSPAGVLRRLNDSMHMTDLDVDIDLATMVHAQLDPATGILHHSSAGHLPLLVVPARRADRSRVVVPVPAIGGPPIGVVPDQRYREQATPLEPDSFLIGFTDGLIERRDQYLDESLFHLQKGLGDLSERSLSDVETLADAILDLAPGGPKDDDLAVLVLAFHPDSSGNDVTARSVDEQRSARRRKVGPVERAVDLDQLLQPPEGEPVSSPTAHLHEI